jgi:hypothetical protein
MKKPILSVISFSLLSVYSFGQDPEVTPVSEINKIMEASSLKYELNISSPGIGLKSHDKLLDDLLFYKEDSAGVMVVRQLELSAEDKVTLETAKINHKDKEYGAALKNYHKIFKKEPAYALIATEMGIAHLSDGNTDSCFYYLDQALELNYSYYKPHYFYGLIYTILADKDKSQLDQAMYNLGRAHLLNRNNAEIKSMFLAVLKKKKMKWLEFQFNPQVDLGYEGEETVKITTGIEWFLYAQYKAVWKYEPGFAEERDVHNVDLSPVVEREALYGLYYLSTFKSTDKSIKGDMAKITKAMSKWPEIIALKKAWDVGQIYEYGLYESILPKAPEQVYLLDKDRINGVLVYMLYSRGGMKLK